MQSAGAIILTDGPQGVLSHHLRYFRDRGLTDETIAAAGIYSLTDKLKAATLLKRERPWRTVVPAIVFPFHGADGSNGYCRLRSDVPRLDRNKKPVKFESPRGEPNRIYLPPGVADVLPNVAQEIAITEGEVKALALTQELVPTIGLVGVFGWKPKDQQRLLPELERVAWQGRTVYIVFDSDYATNENVLAALAWLAKHLADRGAKVRFVRLPDGPSGAKQGIDDFIAAKGADAKREVRALLDTAEDPPAVDPETVKGNAENLDPAKEAETILATMQRDGRSELATYRDVVYRWSSGRYVELPEGEVNADVTLSLNQRFYNVKPAAMRSVVNQLKAQSIVYGRNAPPCWLGQKRRAWLPAESIVAKNGIIHLPSYVAGEPQAEYLEPATPAYFTFTALDYEFAADAATPERWLDFLHNQIWPGDDESVATLQEWFGYSLVDWTALQKILLLCGPKRSGKGTIARVLTATIGNDNVASPTLASLGGQFGLWSLLDRSLAIFADARLSGRSDIAMVVERLLSISGEDGQDIDRKCMKPLTRTRLPVRLMLMSNELPRLTDASGALAGRMIVLAMTRSFYGREDHGLSAALLAERAGILLWAIEGWQRLRARGHFVQPAAGRELGERMEELASPISAFIRERCIVDPGRRVPVQSLYQAWCAWSLSKGRKPENEQMFGRDLAAAIAGLKVTRPREGESRVRMYEGVGMLDESEF